KFTYFFFPCDDEEYLASIGEFADSFNEMREGILETLRSAEYSEPVNQKVDYSGMKFEFETEDLDGNKVTSEEIFGQNEITMINYWGTWCHYCVEEMEELAKINTRLQEVNCGIIGILQDADQEGKIELAKEIMAENGTNYPVLIPTEDMEALKTVKAFPTSFYVDKNGNIIGDVVEGADITRYESDIMALLEGASGDSAAAGAEDAAGSATDLKDTEDVPDGEASAYRVIVTDEEGNPVPDAMVQFCDDSSCTIGETDEEGVAVFEKPEGVYEVHVEEAPEGFAQDGTIV
ncbi:MAG: redoxin domain-containing protein, partial [Lachnospiraceae bacterium]|nr:redoxin domain-containing protein [Lachnospiraceae bacterium]